MKTLAKSSAPSPSGGSTAVGFDRLSLLWLVLAALILPFANGLQNYVPLAAWIGPALLVRFLRTQRAVAGLAVGYVVNAAAFAVGWGPAFVDAGPMFALYTAVFSLLSFAPYIVDRLLCRRLPGAAGALVLPTAWVATEYLLHLVLPLGSFFNLAYTQNSNLPLLQVMSITGLWGVSFVVVLFAGVVNYAWERGFGVERAGRVVAAYALLLAVVLGYGGARLAFERPTGQTVTVAALTTNVDKEVLAEPETPRDTRLIAGQLNAEDLAEMRATMREISDDLLARTRRVARAGAKIVTWSEYNAEAFTDDEAAFLAEARRVAREEGIYLAFPLAVTEPDLAKRSAPAITTINKSVMIKPDGEIAYEYVKHNLLIGWESEHALKGERQIHAIDTPYGKLASVICLDMEYPGFMRLAGQQGVDIVLSGAIDGTPSTKGAPLHSVMASYRTIENGFSLGRSGSYGQNIAADYQGRIWGAANHYTATDRTVIAQLPTKGTATLYTTLGDFFPALCGLALVGLVAVSLIRPTRGRAAA